MSTLAQEDKAKTVTVQNAQELRQALSGIIPGTTIRIAPGDYPPGFSLKEVASVTIEALDASRPPHFKGGNQAWHFTRCENLTVKHLQISGQSHNGINLDDGGKLDQPVSGITLEHLHISDIGPTGNYDGIKASGLDKLTIKNCKIEGWGGQGIDLVGCHQVQITGCELRGKEGYSATAGMQFKGGCSDITVENSRFFKAGLRPINFGGSTGQAFFRPAGARYEARNLTARGNYIEGGQCAAAFVGVDGAEFSGNTIIKPEKWIFRILQETKAEGFPPCRNVVIKDNRIIFSRASIGVDINISGGTAPETFTFAGNTWFAEDKPAASKPKLPVEETKGVYGTDPRTK